MPPLLAVVIVLAAGALVFSLVLALVDWLQKGRKRNSPSLDPGPDEGHNLDADGESD